MATDKQPDSQPADNRGAWRIDRPGRPKPFGVQWRERVFDERLAREVTRRPTEFFASVSDREHRLSEVIRDKHAGRDLQFTRTEQDQWRAFQAASKGVDWQTVLAGYHQAQALSGAKPCRETVQSWVTTYLAHCQVLVDRNEMSKDSYRHKKRFLGEFAAGFGHGLLDRLDAAEAEKWIDGLGFASAATFNSVRKILFACLNRACRLRIIRENPLGTIAERTAFVDNREKILHPWEAAALFTFALKNKNFLRMIGLGALEAFAGLRFTSAFRLEKKDLNIEERGILLPAFKLKTGMHDGSRHYIDTRTLPGLDNLWAWVERAPADAWTMTPRQYLELKSMWFTAAAVRHPPNCLRKSFATYDLAAHQNPGRTSFILGHQDQELLWNTYKGNATTAAARVYQSIAPGTARKIARAGQQRDWNPPRTAPARAGG